MRPEVNNSFNEVCSEHVEMKIAGRLQQIFLGLGNYVINTFYKPLKVTKLNLLIMLDRTKPIYRGKSVLCTGM